MAGGPLTTEADATATAGDDAVVYLNGTFVAGPDARVSVFDHGFAFGDGVFETIRVDQGRPRFLADHVDRIESSLDALSITRPPELSRLESLIGEGLAALGRLDAYVKTVVTRGVGEMAPATCGEPTFLMIVRPLQLPPRRRYSSGIAAITLWTEQPGGRPGQSHKSLSYLRSVLARQEAQAAGAFEGFFTDVAGSLLEGAVSNVFAVTGGRLVTAPAGLCLPGVIRAQVLAAAGARSIPVDQRPIERDAVAAATELFITNSMLGVMPVRSLDGTDLAAVPGPVTAELSLAVEEAAIAVD